MKPSARKNRDHVFSVFHQLNLKDAASYVAEVSFVFYYYIWESQDKGDKGTPVGSLLQGERRGSLEFFRNETAVINFKKKFGAEFSEELPDITADVSNEYGPTEWVIPLITCTDDVCVRAET